MKLMMMEAKVMPPYTPSLSLSVRWQIGSTLLSHSTKAVPMVQLDLQHHHDSKRHKPWSLSILYIIASVIILHSDTCCTPVCNMKRFLWKLQKIYTERSHSPVANSHLEVISQNQYVHVQWLISGIVTPKGYRAVNIVTSTKLHNSPLW